MPVLLIRPFQVGSGISITKDEIIYRFPEILEFYLSAHSDSEIQEITLIYGTEKPSCQTGSARQAISFDPAREVDVSWEWELKRSGVLPPGAQLWWQWEIVDTSGNKLLTDKITQTLNDTRHSWKNLSQSSITIQWYEGTQSFGQVLMDIALRSMKRLSREMGITQTGEIWITVYPTTAELQKALIHTNDWTGGAAITDYDSILLGISPDEMSYAKEVIPHELAHLIVEDYIFNCQGILMPTWLQEGLAVFAEGSLDQDQADLVGKALEEGRLPSLLSLSKSFSAYSDKAALSYSQSGLTVKYLIDTYGPEKIAELLIAVQDGHGIDDALDRVYGLDTNQLDAEWRASLGYPMDASNPAASPEVMPTPTAVPTLPLWSPLSKPTEIPTAALTPTTEPTALATQAATSTGPSPNFVSTQDNPALPDHKTSSPFSICRGALGAPLAVLILLMMPKRKS